MLGPEEGELAVRLARAAVEEAVAHPGQDAYEAFRDRTFPVGWSVPRGVFVTVRQRTDGTLRGCVGFPLAAYPLSAAIPRAAAAAALEDPRFPPLRPEELEQVAFEVSVLTPPELLESAKREEIPRLLVLGRDGLIVERGNRSGLLLPQVAVEEGWTATEFLEQTAFKAGLPPGAWRDPRTRIFRFTAERFEERVPAEKPAAPRPDVSSAPRV